MILMLFVEQAMVGEERKLEKEVVLEEDIPIEKGANACIPAYQ